MESGHYARIMGGNHGRQSWVASIKGIELDGTASLDRAIALPAKPEHAAFPRGVFCSNPIEAGRGEVPPNKALSTCLLKREFIASRFNIMERTLNSARHKKKEDIYLYQRQMSSQYRTNKNRTAGVGNEADALGTSLALSCISSSESQGSGANGCDSSSILRLDPSPLIEHMDC